MKNKILEQRRHRKKNNLMWKEFFCFHDWKPNGEVGMDWCRSNIIRVPAKCKKCGKTRMVLNTYFEEWSDELINKLICYR